MGRQRRELVIPGAILAGGRSRRMGQDKALIGINGIPLARHMLQILDLAGCSPVVLVGRQPALQSLNLRVLAEEAPLAHPLAGVVHALEHFVDCLVLFCPVDLPVLESEDIRAMVSLGHPCVARSGGGLHPLLCVLGPDSLGPARNVLASSGSAHELVSALHPVDLPPARLKNCNRVEDLDAVATSLRVS